MLAAAKVLILSLAAVYLFAVLLLYFMQERIIFPGDPLPADHRFRFDQAFDELTIPVPGATLSALHLHQPASRGLVFFIHGNAGNLETWTGGADFWRSAGFDLFIFDFRGYGKSTGRIGSEPELHGDVRAAWETIAPRYRGRPVVIYGRSLGTALAAELAREADPALLVLVTPYTSLTAIARRAYPWAPTSLLRYPLRTEAMIGEVRSPVLLLHGARDALIPLGESRRLLASIRAPAELVVIEDASHNDIQEYPAYLDALTRRLGSLPPGS